MYTTATVERRLRARREAPASSCGTTTRRCRASGAATAAATSSTAASRSGRASVYVGTLDGRLIALDAEHRQAGAGRSTRSTATKPYTITGAPRVVKGKVIIGNGGAELGVRGYCRLRRRRPASRSGASTPCPAIRRRPFENRRRSRRPRRPGTASGGRSAAAARCGTRWPTTPSSTCSTSAPATARRGTATSAAPAAATTCTCRRSSRCDPDTGELRWHYQTTPGDDWDYTATQHIILADLDDRRQAAQGAHAGAEERLLLRARPRRPASSSRPRSTSRSPGPRASI